MRSLILLLAISAAAMTSCTSAYKTGQTPDDVYYSPERTHDEYVETRQNDDSKYQGTDEYYDDRYLRMKVHNRILWSDLDDSYYYNRRYSYGYYSGIGYNPWTPYTYWNYYYNPYCSHTIYVNAKSPIVYSSPRTVNLNTFNNPVSQNRSVSYFNPKTGMSSATPNTGSGRATNRFFNNTSSNYNNNNSGRSNNNSSSTGNFLRNIFNNSGSSNSSSSTPSSNNSSSSGSSSSGSSSSGSSAPVRKF